MRKMEKRIASEIETLEGADILCIASANWDASLWTNSQHLMSRLARTNRVLFVESLGLRKPRASWRDIYRVGGRIRNWARGVRSVSDNLFVYAPLVIPVYDVSWVRRLNFWILRASLGRIARRHGFRKMILWTFLPTSCDLVGHMGEMLSIYHCVDEYGANPGVPAETIQEMEKILLGKVDLVFTTSKSLYEGKKPYNPNTHYLPNVADADHFCKAMHKETEVPGEIRALPGPVIGFVGALSDYKVDFPLLVHIARSHPDWSIVLVGPVWTGDGNKDIDILNRMKNVHFLGAKPYGDLPGYLKGMDVCIIPFLINETTVNVFPMKFHEYMATGKPVVVVDLPSVKEFDGFCRLAPDCGEFVHAIEESLGESGEMSVERVAVARRNTWEVRIDQIAEIVENRDRDARCPPGKAVPRGRIGIDIRKIHDFGIGTYIRNLVMELSRLDPCREYVVFHGSSEEGTWGANITPVRDDSPKYSIRELISFPRQMQKHRVDLFHSPHYVLPPVRPCPAVVTIHDLIHLKYPPSRSAAVYAKVMMKAATRSASRIITVSQSSKDDMIRALGTDPEKITVIYNAVDRRFRPLDRDAAREEVCRSIGVEGHYILCVSNFLPHKNLHRLIDAFRELRRIGYGGSLVLAGGPLTRASGLAELVEENGLSGIVHFPGFVSDEFLPILYNGAHIFVFPSLYEGFGLPPLEAMACGVPAVVSNTRAIREVTGDAAISVNPGSGEEIANGIITLLEDTDLYERQKKAGIDRAARFSWKATAEATLGVYKEVLSHG